MYKTKKIVHIQFRGKQPFLVGGGGGGGGGGVTVIYVYWCLLCLFSFIKIHSSVTSSCCVHDLLLI